MTEQEELNYLIQNSPASLPDDPSSSGWSTAQIKAKFYDGLFFLYNLFKQNRTNLTGAVNDMQNIVNTINEAYANILTGETVKAKYDEDNNVIKETYAKILNITNGTISVLKYKKENGTDTDFVYNIEKNLTTLTTAFNTLKTWTDNLKSTTSEESVLRAVQATKDSLGNVIKDTYATVTSVSLLNTAITNIINGTTIVDKAYKDMDGNRIDTTYVKIANIVNALNDTSTNKPLSAAQGKALKDMIDAINTVLSSDTTTLDTLQEVVNYIKNNKSLIDGITISKMAFTDLVKNLTTNNDNLPLAASQGYALKAMIDAINDVEDGIEAAEALRVIAEAGRVEAEEARQTGYSGFDSRITANTNAIAGIKDGTNIDSFGDVESALATKANTSDVYAKSEVYTKTETQALQSATLEASKTYCDESIKDLQWQLGTYDLGVETVNGTTSLLPTPANTIQATMVRVDGKSEVMVNDFDSNLTSISDDTGVTHSKVGNSYVIVNSSSSSSRIVLNTNLNGKHTFVFDSDTAIPYGFRINSLSLQNNIVVGKNIFEDIAFAGNNPISIYVPANSTVTISNIVSTTNYFTGIHNLELSGLKVEGANMYDISKATVGVRLTNNGTYVSENNTTSDFIKVESGDHIYMSSCNAFALYDTNKTQIGNVYFYDSDGAHNYSDVSDGYLRFTHRNTSTNIMVNIGSALLPYEPYVSQTLAIDLTTIEDSGGNKLFADGKLREGDYITPTYQESAKNKIVLNGSENWSYEGSAYYRFRIADFATSYGVKIPASNNDVFNGLISDNNYPIVTANYGFSERATQKSCTLTVNGALFIYDYTITSLADWKAKLQANPITLEFERATHLTSNTNLSQLVKFEAHSNGSITLVNTNNQDTTSTFKYLKEVAK